MRAFAIALSSVALILASTGALATVAQPVPLPEEPSVAPQLEIDGVGIGTLDSRKGVDFSDSSLLVGAAQRLYESGVGSMGLGILAPDRGPLQGTASSASSTPFLDQGFVDFQARSVEALVGRSDNPGAHLVDFPLLREDDLVGMTFRLDPFSSGGAPEEHRYSDVASVTFNQGLSVFENLHVQRQPGALAESAGVLNSFGLTMEYLAPPGAEALSRVVSAGIAYEHEVPFGTLGQGLDQISAGAVLNVRESVTDRVDFRAQDILNLGSDLSALSAQSDAFRARYNAVAASLRYLHSPFGKPGFQLALTGGYRGFLDVPASERGAALTAIQRLGEGFDAVAQVLAESRQGALAAVNGAWESRFELGLIYDFAATLNEHIGARRTPLNYQHQYLED